MESHDANTASLAALLHAERLARGISPAVLLEQLEADRRFQSRQSGRYDALARAARASFEGGTTPGGPTAIVDLVRQAGMPAAANAGPVLLVSESQPFQPDLDSLHDQVLLRLLAGLETLGRRTAILRIPAARVRPLRWRLERLPDRPAGIVSVGLSNPACLEVLRSAAPLVRIAARSALPRAIPCVEHDAMLEARRIAACAGAHKVEQIAFVAGLERIGGRRRMEAVDLAVLADLVREAHNRHMAVPGNLTFWADIDRSLETAGVLAMIRKHAVSRMLVVVSRPAWAAQAAAAVAGQDGLRVVCRHWSDDASVGNVPVIGPDVDQLALAALVRLLGPDRLPAQAAVLVPPLWHRGP